MLTDSSSLQSFTVRILGDFLSFLSALASNNAFIIKLVKMWLGRTLKISFNIYIFLQKKEFS